jgi:hypothetical protein
MNPSHFPAARIACNDSSDRWRLGCYHKPQDVPLLIVNGQRRFVDAGSAVNNELRRRFST